MVSLTLFYNFIIDNSYIEGRYWEKVWSFPTEGDSGGSNYKNQDLGNMEWSQLNITHILNILENDFKDEIKSTDEVFLCI
jgi:hypothetical protein